jgi:hypothetical protein
MSESNKEKTLDLEDKLASLHPRFLEIIKQVYPLAVLGSLCIAISAFAHQSYPEAQAYALTSAALFLMAFVSSFLFEMFKAKSFALTSYISTALAVLLLFVAIFEFGVNVPMIARTPMIVLGFVFIIFFSSTYYSAFKAIRKVKSRLARASAWTGIFCGASFISMLVYVEMYFMFSGEQIKNDLFWNVWIALICLSFAFLLVFTFLVLRERKELSSAVMQI